MIGLPLQQLLAHNDSAESARHDEAQTFRYSVLACVHAGHYVSAQRARVSACVHAGDRGNSIDVEALNCLPFLQRAEFCAFCNCVMDRTTLDKTLSDSSGHHSIRVRPEVAEGAHIPLTDSQFNDLITVHLADWLEQVRVQMSC